MTERQAKAFEDFWNCVAQVEEKVRRYGHTSYGPVELEDKWDEALAKAYEAVRPYLKRFKVERPFQAPAELPGRTVFMAETGHQALMFLLNPPEKLCGHASVLDSEEYHQVKQEAAEEFKQIRSARKRAGSSTGKRKERVEGDVFLLRTALLQHHAADKKRGSSTPLTEKQIADFLGWLQPRVSRRMKIIFKGGAKGYHALCKSGKVFEYVCNPRTGRREAIQPDADELDEEA